MLVNLFFSLSPISTALLRVILNILNEYTHNNVSVYVVRQAWFGTQTTFFVDLTHWYNKVHNPKDIIDSATNIFALNVEGSRSIESWWGVDGCEGDAITHFDLYNCTLIQLTDFKKYWKLNYFINWPFK